MEHKSTLIESDSEMARGLAKWREYYYQAINELHFDHRNAKDYADDHFREWWRENV